ncbi:MAG: TIGR04282 family arsenosugar biosynthesis glycosyltransferase [Spirochaetota bacterium]
MKEPDRKALAVFVRYLQAGKVKSRLEEGIGSAIITADLYRCFVMDVLDAASSVHDTIIISYEPSVKERTYREWLGDSFEYIQQRGDDIGARMFHAFEDVFQAGYRTCFLMGSDIPDLPEKIISDGLRQLDSVDAVIGPALDGGYYCIGLRKNALSGDFFYNIQWGTYSVLSATLTRLETAGVEYFSLPEWGDVDTLDDLRDLVSRNQLSLFRKSHTMRYIRSQHLLQSIL